MSGRDNPKVLCVDDEGRILEGLALHLRKEYEVHTATSGVQALKILKEIGGAAVVISDMRMPDMDGATFLQHVLNYHPDATRILLTGDPGRDAAISAVNQARVFRFLTKPCPPDQLKAAVEAAVTQHRLVNVERSILRETLIGCIKALTDVLAIVNPVAFGRASRIKRLAMELAERVGCKGLWELEAGALLSQLGYISLPMELVEKLYFGENLTPEERTLAKAVPDVITPLLEHIPRLETVIELLTSLRWSDEAVARLGDGSIGLGARILGLVLDYDSLTAQGHDANVAVQTLRGRSARFGADLIEQLSQQVGAGASASELREMPLRLVQPGMVMMQDVRTHQGTLLVPRGFEVTSLFLDRVRNFGPDLVNESVKVLVPAARPVRAA